MKEIGGFFGLELTLRKEYHNNAIKLNSGRNALKYILKAQKVSRVYIPTFICDSMIEPLEELGIDYVFYNIDETFEIIDNFILKEKEKLVYVNYFALKSEYILKLSERYGTKLIVDNTQAFFEIPVKNIDTIYSPRKFFGVSDGGYLYTDYILNENFDIDESIGFMKHLIGRIEKNASDFYSEFQDAEKRLANQPIKKMSKITSRILCSIDYEQIMKIRKENFDFLHKEFKNINILKDISVKATPFVYPLMVDIPELRNVLIKHKIYIAKYWDEVLYRENSSKLEKKFVKQIIPLPIDQRYSTDDMKGMIEVVQGCL